MRETALVSICRDNDRFAKKAFLHRRGCRLGSISVDALFLVLSSGSIHANNQIRIFELYFALFRLPAAEKQATR